jgi:hypothetical protein
MMTTENTNTIDPLNQLMTLVHHAVRYPDPRMPNTPDIFGLNDVDFTTEHRKKLMSLGRMRLFPEEVCAEVFGSQEASALHKLGLIRSRLQTFIDTFTVSFLNGAANALADTKLPEFTEMVASFKSQFEDAQREYLDHYQDLIETSVEFWRKKSSMYHITPDQMDNAIRNYLPTSDKLEKKFCFDVIHFQITSPVKMTLNEIDAQYVAQVQARNEIAEAAATQLEEEVESFKEEWITGLREKAKETMTNLVNAIEANKWNQKSINAATKWIDNILGPMNLFNDTELQQFMNNTKAELLSMNAQDVKKDESLQDRIKTLLGEKVDELNTMVEADKQEIIDNFGKIGHRKIVDPF